jgi:hypothetical protein
MNLSDPEISRLIDREGISGLGLYVIIKDQLIRSGGMTLPEMTAFMDIYTYPEMVTRIVTTYNLFLTNDGVTYFPYGKRANEFTVDDAQVLFDQKGLRGRFFSKLKTIHNLTEDKISEEFSKWKERNAGIQFKDERHLENSFSYWLSMNVKDKASKQVVDWSSI